MWFLRLSGWPVFLVIVGSLVLLMILLSILFTKLSSRSVVQNAILAATTITVVAVLLLTVVSLITRAWAAE